MDDKPEVDPEFSFVWNLWNMLHRTRQAGVGATPIPFSEAVSCVSFYCPDFTLEEKEFILNMVMSLEDTWLTWARTKQKNA